MSAGRPRSVPSYRRHKQSGQAVVTLTDGCGNRHDALLGQFGTKESRLAYAQTIAEWEAAGRRPPPDDAARADLTLNELVLAFVRHARAYYRDAATGEPTREADNVALALRPLRRLFGHTEAAAFGPLRFKAYRGELVRSGLSRPVVNKWCGVVKRMIGWAVAEELAPAAVAHALREVKGLKRGRTDAPEPPPVRPVPEAHLTAALDHMPRAVAAMAELQRLCGARAGEIVLLRGSDLSTSGAVWTFTPMRHKSTHRGLTRTIYLGPKAQDVLRPFLKTDLSAFVFSPVESEAERSTDRRANRATPLWPSHVRAQQKKRAKRRKRPPADRYTVPSYRRAIARACEAADVPTFSPHRLRHSFGTAARRAFDLDSARACLGHTSPAVSEVYCERDAALAERVVLKIG